MGYTLRSRMPLDGIEILAAARQNLAYAPAHSIAAPTEGCMCASVFEYELRALSSVCPCPF